MSAEAHAHKEEAPHAEPHHAAPAADHHAAPAANDNVEHHPPKPHAAKGAANDNVEHPAAKAPAAGARTQPPISKFYNKLKSGLTSSSSSVVASTSAFGQFARKVFRSGELEPVEQVGIVKTPVYAAGQILDGTVLSAPRRVVEIAEPIAASALATLRTLGSVFHPIDNLTHPIKFLKKPARIVTSSLMLNKNLAMAVPRIAHEFIDRAIARPIEQIGTQLRRVPIIGPLIATPTTWLSRKIADIVGSVKTAVDWATSPIDHLHNWTSPDGSPTPAAAAAAHKPAHGKAANDDVEKHHAPAAAAHH